jgi:hypothetical protein
MRGLRRKIKQNRNIPSGIFALTVAFCFQNCGKAFESTHNDESAAPFGSSVDFQSPTVPQNLAATPMSPSQISLSWEIATDNLGLAGYRIFRDGTLISTITSIYYLDVGLIPSTTYSYTVVAFDHAGNQSAQATPAFASTQAGTIPPPSTEPITMPTRQWIGLELPNKDAIGLSFGAKHLSGALNPKDGRVYFVGGDYNGGSYIQQVLSLSIKDRLAAPANPMAGWRRDFPRGTGVPSEPSGYTLCPSPPQLGPKHPDFVGWLWDERIGKFWYVPGTEVLAADNCMGESVKAVSDPYFSWGRILQYDPITGTFTDVADAGYGHNKTWWSVLDPLKNRILRPWYGGPGSSLDVYDIGAKAWSTKALGPTNSLGGEVRLFQSYLGVDRSGRMVYGISAGRLHRFSMDLVTDSTGAYVLEDLGPSPITKDAETKMAWDPHSNVLLVVGLNDRAFYAYHPDTKQWEKLEALANNGFQASGKVLFYDEVNNVLGWFGQSDPSPDVSSAPYLFLYRYAIQK